MDGIAAAREMAADCLCFRSRRVSRMLTRLYDEALRPSGLQATQLTLLNAIALCGVDGAAMPRLSEILSMAGTTLSRNLRAVEKAGWVRVEPMATDRRVRLAHLTPAGEELLTRALPLWRQAQERIAEILGPETATEIRDQFDAVVAAAAAQQAAP